MAPPRIDRPNPDRRATALSLAVALALATSCSDPGAARSELRLLDARPEPETSLLLNDDIRLTFDAPIDQTTVTLESVRLERVGATGASRVASGRWEVEGRSLRFVPDGVRSPDLADGGYVPGATYRLTIAGFPFLGAVRSLDGASLERSVSLTYPVVRATTGQAVLRDASPETTSRLRLLPSATGAENTRPIQWTEPLRLACDEPLDPRTIRPREYEVRAYRDPRNPEPVLYDPPAIAVDRIVLESNEGEDAEGGGGARLVVHFAQPLPIPDGSFAREFVFKERDGVVPSLKDFSGGDAFGRRIRFFAARQDVLPSESDQSYEFEFLDDLDFVPVHDPASDGTARWSGTGRVGIRYPAAAGDGADGAVTLGGAEARGDVRATRIALLEGDTCTLESEGLVVLRAQGRIELDGRLERAAPPDLPPPMWDPVERPFADSARGAECLSEWLRAAREADSPWTVIIAGGDLVVRGRIDVGTPLLLVAGGRIRGAGMPRAAEGQLWLLGDGGGFELPHHRNPGAIPNVAPPLVIDEPLANPLVEALTFVAISSPVPKGSNPRAWLSPEIRGSGGSSGSYLVQYLRADALRGGEEGLGQAVRYDEPNGAMEPDSLGGGAIRLRIELEVRPGPGAWEPPYVDRVRLSWSPDR
ncbi:MAG: Ig-like domain-containing protein [Planctomycetota bacterium]